MQFTQLGFAPELLPFFLQAARENGYSDPTPIQAKVIPAMLLGLDIVASAPTGSGKTAAFVLPLLEQAGRQLARPKRGTAVLVLVPTRELAAQTGEVMLRLAKNFPKPPKVAVIFGGVSINPQMMNLRGGADIVVATPGRLLDLLDHNALQLDQLKTLVLDEADKLLDMGFSDELARILALLPPKRQNALFSATFSPAVEQLASTVVLEPLRIIVQAEAESQPDIAQRAIEVDPSKRTQLLRFLILNEKLTRVLVFVATKHAAEIVADKLRKANILAEPFHGELSQGKRQQVLMDFKASAVRVVVATDVAARGLDISALPVVVNYDLPRSAVDYTHRIGRTGRAGEAGVAISFVSAANEQHFKLIEKRCNIAMAREQVAGFEPVETQIVNAADPDTTGGIKGKRPNKKDKLRAAQANT